MKFILKVFTIFTGSQKKYCAGIVFHMMLGAILEAVGIGAILPLISIMGDPLFLEKNSFIREKLLPLNIHLHIEFVILLAVLLILFYLFKNLYMAWQLKIQMKFVTTNQIYYAGELFAEYLSKPYKYHLENNSAILIKNINKGIIEVFSNLILPIFMLLTEIATAAMIWIMLIYIDPFTAVVVAGVLGFVMYGIIMFFRKKISQQGKLQNEYSAVYLKWLNQGFGSIKETKIFCKEQFFLEKFNSAYKKYGEANNGFLYLNQLPRMLLECIVVCGLLLMIIIKLLLGYHPLEIVPVLGVLSLAAFRLMPCANRIVNLSNGIKFQMPLFNELYEDLIVIKEKQIVKKDVYLESKLIFRDSIEVRNLGFRYAAGQKKIIENIDFVIPKGSFVGIIGSSGAGKTTFVDILLGLLLPTEGEVFVDGVNIHKDIHLWQSNLAYVPQHIYLIDGTIQENIALGISNELVEKTRLNRVIEMVELKEFINSLPEKLYTSVGERGVKLSGGQCQRIGIARALYHNPSVLILDEATSALDGKTERSITDTILKLKGEITIIAIAHRMSTLSDCDFKIKFENGKAEILK